ncbi:MAG TPA: YesL family protein [Clostridiales bacterium]|nr:YesL family protein [Clostridiales bacterium]
MVISMGTLFNLDNPVFTAINKFVDMLFLSIVYIIICIPIITIGPATTALYYTVVKNVRKERGYPFREFFKSFKDNFKQGALITIMLVVAYIVMYIDIQFAKTLTGIPNMILVSIFMGMLIVLVSINIYVFPYLSRFEAKTKQTLLNSLFLAIRHLPSTLLLIVILIAGASLAFIIPIFIIIVPSLTVLLQSFLIERIFKKYMPDKSKENLEEGIDEWYLE